MARGDYRYPGIYLIANTINGKVYVGSSKNVADRLHCHQSHLRSKIHHNKHLLAAVEQYGIGNFSFELWETCPISNLREREAYWIKSFNSNNREIGYNNSIDTNCPARGRKQSTEEIGIRVLKIRKHRKFVNPKGKIYETNNTKEFANKHRLNYEGMTSVANKRRYSYRGWRLATKETIGINHTDIRVGKPRLGRKIPL